jgi:enoyl-CoA hydratase/carnithine racemase
MFSAQQGFEWGLFTQIVEPADLMPTSMKVVETLATRAPLALAVAKQAINQGHDHTLAAGLRLEADLFSKIFETQDHKEGIKAFVEKRAPQFAGK